MRITWITFLDPFVLSGGGELNHRAAIVEGRRRGHTITVTAFLGRRVQRALRRARLARRITVDWESDLFILADLANYPAFPVRFSHDFVDRVLETGRAAVSQQAWVDVCAYDMPCGGDRAACPSSCDRAWANFLYRRARIAIFNSPMQRRMVEAILDVPLPSEQILCRPQIDTSRFRPLGRDRDFDVLYVGTISRPKGYYNLLRRFGPDRLTLAGKSVLHEPVQGNYLGPVSYDDLPELYNRARIFAHLPEWYEPMGRTVVEAALCGCELVLNERVGVASYPRSEWSDASTIERNGRRFWQELERASSGIH
jgi:glycosyltransferase involved in cell wall biosynthesis